MYRMSATLRASIANCPTFCYIGQCYGLHLQTTVVGLLGVEQMAAIGVDTNAIAVVPNIGNTDVMSSSSLSKIGQQFLRFFALRAFEKCYGYYKAKQCNDSYN